MLTLTPSKTLSDEPICSHTCSMDHLMISQYWRKSADTTYLTHADVQRNSLAESGMRVLRRLEVGHDGLRTPKGRENCLRIYQAVKYLGWSVHNPPTILISVPRETLEGQESGVTLSPVGRGLHMGPVIPFLP